MYFIYLSVSSIQSILSSYELIYLPEYLVISLSFYRMNELLSVYQGRLEDCKNNIPRGARKQNLPSSNMDALPDKKVGLLSGEVQAFISEGVEILMFLPPFSFSSSLSREIK